MQPNKQTQDFDIFYLVMGKMLFIATDFENELIALFNFYKIRTNGLLLRDPKLLDLLFAKHKPAKNRLGEMKMQGDVLDYMSRAIECRNYIAHELALTVYNIEADQYSLDKFVEYEIKTHIEPILKASYEIKAFWAIRNNSTLNTSWITNQISWIKQGTDES